MMPIDRVRERYDRDTMFRYLVDSMTACVLRLELTPSELREAAVLACIRAEERHPRPFSTFFLQRLRHEGQIDNAAPLDAIAVQRIVARVAVALKPGEEAPAYAIDPPPPGCRWETDAEFRERIREGFQQAGDD